MRGTAGIALVLSLLPLPGQAEPQVMSAVFQAPTDRYQHGVFGGRPSYGELVIVHRDCATCAPVPLRVTLPEDRVFEDYEARIVDLDGDRLREVLVVETDVRLGASLAVYDGQGKRTATAHLGESQRWLAPAGVGDFDDDGRVEIAYVDRPHLVRELVFVRYDGKALTEIARVPGLTNHRFGDARIAGGARNCGSGAEVVLSDAARLRVMAVRLDGQPPREVARVEKPGRINRALANAMRCRG